MEREKKNLIRVGIIGGIYLAYVLSTRSNPDQFCPKGQNLVPVYPNETVSKVIRNHHPEADAFEVLTKAVLNKKQHEEPVDSLSHEDRFLETPRVIGICVEGDSQEP